MNGFSLLLTIASLGVVYSWRTGVDQQQEYVLQIEPEIVQYLKTPPSRAELKQMIADAGIDVRTAVRRRESLYAELGLADATDDELLDAMTEHPILIERPFVVTAKGTRLARPIDAVHEIL